LHVQPENPLFPNFIVKRNERHAALARHNRVSEDITRFNTAGLYPAITRRRRGVQGSALG